MSSPGDGRNEGEHHHFAIWKQGSFSCLAPGQAESMTSGSVSAMGPLQRRSECLSGGDAVEVVLVALFNPRADDIAGRELAGVAQMHLAVDLRRVGF